MYFVRTVISNTFALREKCPYLDLFWSIFSLILIEYREILCEILCISPYSVQMRKNTDQNKSKYGPFSHSVGNMYYCVKQVVILYVLVPYFQIPSEY